MEQLIERFRKKIAQTQTNFVRSIMFQINWEARLIGLKGARGVGKTTLLLQFIKLRLLNEIDSSLYVSLDNIWFTEHKLTDLVDVFAKKGGKYLFLDEVHKYSNWSIEIKNIYDDYPEIKIVFTGSSLLEILNARADLSRRAVIYSMQGLSFREYLNIELNMDLKTVTLEEIINQHSAVSREIVSKVKPLQHFDLYLQNGYYPFYKEVPNLYHSRLEEVINMVLEVELPQLRNVNVAYVSKLKQLMYIVSESAPFTPNISKISERIGVNRETLLGYLFYLNEAHLLFSTYKDAKGITLLQKPDKLYLENTNLMYALNGRSVSIGNARETFFANQLRYSHLIEISKQSDFIVDGKYTFEIGGKNKNKTQIEGLQDAYVALDDIEYGFENKIPLWIFGFLY